MKDNKNDLYHDTNISKRKYQDIQHSLDLICNIAEKENDPVVKQKLDQTAQVFSEYRKIIDDQVKIKELNAKNNAAFELIKKQDRLGFWLVASFMFLMFSFIIIFNL